MNATSISGSPAHASQPAAVPALATEMESLRLLLLGAAEALCAGDASEVQQMCNQLTNLAVNLRPAFSEFFPNGSAMAAIELEQQRQRVLLPLLQARALYLAGLRRWRRALRLRRNLVEMQTGAPFGDAEFSRWC